MKKKRVAGSLTVEASLILPLFAGATLIFVFFIKLMAFELSLQSAIVKTAESIASYGYVLNKAEHRLDDKKDELLESIPFGKQLYECLQTEADAYTLKLLTSRYMDTGAAKAARVIGGWESVEFKGSTVRDEADCVVIVVSYKIRLPFAAKLVPALTINQKAAAALFSGKITGSTNSKREGIVYVTKNGTVYHTDMNCTYLTLSTSEVNYSEIPELRNLSGGKYYGCEFCVRDKSVFSKVYITKDGNRYHASSDCIALRRIIYERNVDEIDLPMCTRCKEKDGD